MTQSGGPPDTTEFPRALFVDAITKSFRPLHQLGKSIRRTALSDVTFSVGEGECLGIIGPNGAGKSTLLRLIAGITLPDSGEIRRNGPISAVIALDAGFHPDLTGAENIGLIGPLMGYRRRDIIDNLDQIVRFSGLGDAIHRPVKQYSTGMLARLALSVALHAPAGIIAIDEVISVGDLEFQRQAVDRLVELHREGRTVLLVSHDLYLVGQVCTRTLLLDEGRLVDDGDPQRVIGGYLGVEELPDQAASLNVSCAKPRTELGQSVTVEVRLDSSARHPDASASLDIVMSISADHAFVEETGPKVIGTSAIDVDVTRKGVTSWTMEVSTAGLPPGQYRARVNLLDADGKAISSASTTIHVEGVPPNGPAAWLAGTWVEVANASDRAEEVGYGPDH